MSKTIISVALTGAWPTRQNNPNIPYTPREIANDAVECHQAGAAIVHLHMRDEEGKGSMDINRFTETVGYIRAERPNVVINLTTSGALDATDEERMAHLIALKPEMASYDCGSMNWMHNSVFLNPPAFLEKLGMTMSELGVKPEIEVFDVGMIYNAIYYVKKGVLKAPMHFQFCLGAAGGATATVENLVHMRSQIPEGSTWSAFGIGAQTLPITYATLALGGHVRVGMEDNVYYAKGRLAKSNAEFVERAVRLVKEFNNEPATSDDSREILKLRR